MDQNTATLIIGLAGIVATLIASGLGLYFTARARSAPLREYLYTKQVDLVSQVLLTIGRIRIFIAMAIDPESPYQKQARDDLGKKVKILSELCDTAAALLPTELYAEVRQTERFVVDFVVNLDEGNGVSEFPAKLDSYAAKTVLVARACLGIDELSEESLALFASPRELAKLSKLKPEEIMREIRNSKKE